jgi:predicted polyphosphate/ATP-dependent NAD kinase
MPETTLFENKTVEQMGEETLRRHVLKLQERLQMQSAALEAIEREHDKTKADNLRMSNVIEMSRRYVLSVVRVLFPASEIIAIVTKWEVKK